jgi:tRNA dimethylallyltransferase
LRAVAPDRAATVDLRNPRRVVRALEIAALDGGAGVLPPPRGYGAPVGWIGLAVERPTHLAWIAARARAQFDTGLVEEAGALRERFDPALPAFAAIGYRAAWAVLDGRLDREQAIAEDARRNAAFAKRQRTWFKAEPDIRWLDPSTGSHSQPTLELARRLVRP